MRSLTFDIDVVIRYYNYGNRFYYREVKRLFELLQRKAGERANEYVRRVLLHNIVIMELEPGEQIQESEIGDLFKVSRTPVREALIELAQLRLIDIYPQRGTYVSLIDLKLVEDGRYLRSILEPDLAAMACETATPKIIEKLQENIVLQAYYEKKDIDKFMKLDDEFHKIIYMASDKSYLYEIVRNASLHFDRVRKLRLLVEYPLKVKDTHEEIMQAIQDKDKKTARAKMESHLSAEIYDIEILKGRYAHYFAHVKESLEMNVI